MYILVALLSATDRDGLNSRRLLEIVQLNEGSEFLAYFPQWGDKYLKVRFVITSNSHIVKVFCFGER
jgi:hypothetical protein